jgi:hypothetical protein
MERKPQSFANHAKYDPPFHFFLLPILLINLIAAVVNLIRFPSLASGWLVVLALAAAVAVARVRAYATHLQDRVIRLEERLRLASVLEEPLRARIGQLADTQLVALRFASDAELPGLVQRALDEKLDRTQIKKAVTAWRPDYSRV